MRNLRLRRRPQNVDGLSQRYKLHSFQRLNSLNQKLFFRALPFMELVDESRKTRLSMTALLNEDKLLVSYKTDDTRYVKTGKESF